MPLISLSNWISIEKILYCVHAVLQGTLEDLAETNCKHMRCQIPVSISHGLTVSCIESKIETTVAQSKCYSSQSQGAMSTLERKAEVFLVRRLSVEHHLAEWHFLLNKLTDQSTLDRCCVGQMSCRSNVRRPSGVSIKCPSAKRRVSQMSVGQTARRSNVRRPNGASVKCLSAKRRVGQMSVGRAAFGGQSRRRSPWKFW